MYDLDRLFREMDSAAQAEEEAPAQEVLIQALEGESPIDTLIRVFNEPGGIAFLSPLSIPQEFYEEIIQGRKTPFITERHIELMNQYDWDFFFKEFVNPNKAQWNKALSLFFDTLKIVPAECDSYF